MIFDCYGYVRTFGVHYKNERKSQMPTLREATRKKAPYPKARRLKVQRLSMRIDESSKTKLERAAAYSAESVSDYVVTRALRAAEADITTHEKITLPEPIWNAFFEALKNPPKSNARLNAILKLHDQEVVSR